MFSMEYHLCPALAWFCFFSALAANFTIAQICATLLRQLANVQQKG
jgi:hypothetical protein